LSNLFCRFNRKGTKITKNNCIRQFDIDKALQRGVYLQGLRLKKDSFRMRRAIPAYTQSV